MKFKNLKKSDREFIRTTYLQADSKWKAQRILSEAFDVSDRSIRTWTNLLGISGDGVTEFEGTRKAKIMIYDIETSRVSAKVWWTGKQYINHKSLKSEPAIISISYKWLGEDKIHAFTWDENHCDKQLMIDFLDVYNEADMLIGQNNDRFDNRWVNARAMKHNLYVNLNVKSFDIMKQTKRLFRLPSYSMDYITKYLNVENKLTHEGMHMWDMIEDGNKSQQKEYLQKMVDYNVGDIVSTEAMYTRLRKYMGHKMHIGVLQGSEAWTSPSDGTKNVTLLRVTTSVAGTLQYIMQSNTDGVTYKLSNRLYQHYLEQL